MKASIHPKFFEDATVTCSCGNTFKTGSVKQSITVETCSKCHPFYTGEQKFLDTKGTVEKFLKKEKVGKAYKLQVAEKKDKTTNKQGKEVKSLRELLGEA